MHRFLALSLALGCVTPALAAEPVVITGHTDAITGVAFAPDGKTVATVSADKTLRVWDAKTGKQLASVDAHTGTATGVAFSASGKGIITGGYGPKPEGKKPQEGEVKVWSPDLKSYPSSELARYAVEAVTFDPNNRRVLAGSGKFAYAWDGTGDDERQVTFAVTPNGTRAVSGGQDHSVRVWNIETGKEERKITSHLGPVMSVAMATDGKTVATASGLDGTVRIWEVESGKEVRVLRLPKTAKGPCRVAYAPDGKRLAVASFDNSVRVYDLTAE